jgi:hypothetical protein
MMYKNRGAFLIEMFFLKTEEIFMFNWDEVNIKLANKIEKYCQELVEINKHILVSVNLIGESATDNWTEKDLVKLLVIVDKVDLDLLKANMKLVSKGIKIGIIAPLFLTLEHINSSSDVFPIEFWDMKTRHIAIFGKDCFSDINIEDSNLRLECEQEIKGKLIRLRQAYLEIGSKQKQIKNLIYESFSAFMPVFSNMLRLKHIEVPKNKIDILDNFSETYAINVGILKDINSGEFEQIKGLELEIFFGDYLEIIEKIALVIDKLEV